LPATQESFEKRGDPRFAIDFIWHFCWHALHANFSDKICCDLLEARLVASKFFTIVLGGTAALHAYRVWGAVIF
jgi:hypothetical protein